VTIPIGIAFIVLGFGLCIYGSIPERGWYFKTTVSSLNEVALREELIIEWGPFRNADDCFRAQQGGYVGANATTCYRRP